MENALLTGHTGGGTDQHIHYYPAYTVCVGTIGSQQSDRGIQEYSVTVSVSLAS